MKVYLPGSAAFSVSVIFFCVGRMMDEVRSVATSGVMRCTALVMNTFEVSGLSPTVLIKSV